MNSFNLGSQGDSRLGGPRKSIMEQIEEIRKETSSRGKYANNYINHDLIKNRNSPLKPSGIPSGKKEQSGNLNSISGSKN